MRGNVIQSDQMDDFYSFRIVVALAVAKSIQNIQLIQGAKWIDTAKYTDCMVNYF